MLAWLAMTNSACPGPRPLKNFTYFLHFLLDKFIKICYNIYRKCEQEVFDMKSLWEVILPNKIVYIRGKKSEILMQFQKIIKITRINEKELFEVLEQGVIKI